MARVARLAGNDVKELQSLPRDTFVAENRRDVWDGLVARVRAEGREVNARRVVGFPSKGSDVMKEFRIVWRVEASRFLTG
jgi:hypothetical protein